MSSIFSIYKNLILFLDENSIFCENVIEKLFDKMPIEFV